MLPRSRLALGLLVVYTLVNLAGMIYAAVIGEVGHSALHAALLVPVGWVVLRRGSTRGAASPAQIATKAEFPNRLTNLEQSIDAVAIEVERIVEGQRNLTNLLAENEVRRAPEQRAPDAAKTDQS